MAVAKRLQQGIRALLAFSRPVDYGLAATVLTPQQLQLFSRMSRVEQLHSLNVLRDVLDQATVTPHDLALAALMHDIGKSRYKLAVWQKTLAVLTRKGLPGLYRHLSKRATLSLWTAPFIVAECHPSWSAELLATTDVSDCALWLVVHHQEPAEQWEQHPNFTLLRRLQAADERN